MFGLIIDQIINGIMIGSIYAMVALGLTMVFGIWGIFNIAHCEFLMIGSYVAFFLTVQLSMNYYEAMLIATLFVAFLGVITARLTFRYTRYQIINGLIMSMALILIFQNIALLLWSPTPREIPPPFLKQYNLFDLSISGQRLVSFFLVLIILIISFLFLNKTRLGKAILATAQNSEAAELMGIKINKVEALSFAIGTGMAGIAGVLIGSIFVITPFMGFRYLLKGFVVALLGGLGNLWGAVIAGLILGIVESVGSGLTSAEWQDAYGYVLLLLLLSFRPQGLFGEKE